MNLTTNVSINDKNSKKIEDPKPYLRIHSIDFLKGFSVSIIVLIYTADAWLDKDSRVFYGFLCLFLDVFGILIFIFLFSLTVIFWWKKKMGINPDKTIRNEILYRALILIILGMVFNIIFYRNIPFPLNLWTWNILIYMGCAYVICYYAVRLSRGVRWIIGFFIFFITTPIREILIIMKDNSPVFMIIHYIIISPNPEVPFLPYIALCFFSTIFGERILESMLLESKEAYLDVFRTLIIFGFIFILLSIIYGYELVTPNNLDSSDYPQIKLIPIIQNQGIIKIDGVPGFFIRGTAPNLFYGLGISLLLLGAAIYLIDIKKVHNKFIRVFTFLGNRALTVFLIHFIGLLFFLKSISFLIFLPLFFLFIVFLGFIVYIWNKFGKGFGTVEWAMSKLIIKRKFDK